MSLRPNEREAHREAACFFLELVNAYHQKKEGHLSSEAFESFMEELMSTHEEKLQLALIAGGAYYYQVVRDACELSDASVDDYLKRVSLATASGGM